MIARNVLMLSSVVDVVESEWAVSGGEIVLLVAGIVLTLILIAIFLFILIRARHER